MNNRWYDQTRWDIRCEWGLRGVEMLAPISDVVIIVDVLSFSTCVDVAVSHGAEAFPYRWRDASVEKFADERGARAAGRRSEGALSLSPLSMRSLTRGDRIVLPSPNGSTLTLSTGSTSTLCGCLRNAAAVAEHAASLGRRIAVIPAGERWSDDGSLRPAVEDWWGVGAIVAAIPGQGRRSPEAVAAVAAFDIVRGDLPAQLAVSGSGRELIEAGYGEDVACAAELNVSGTCPVLRHGAYVAADQKR